MNETETKQAVEYRLWRAALDKQLTRESQRQEEAKERLIDSILVQDIFR